MTARQSLEELLDLLFGFEDLRRFVEKGLGRPDVGTIGEAISWEHLKPAHRAARVVEALELHGAVDDAFFDRLLATFPEQAPEIETVARQWLPKRVAREVGAQRRALPAAADRPEDGVWDVFLAHAGPDGAAADQLYELLVEQGLHIFLDSRCLRLGDRWDEVIPAALTGARKVVVLISRRTREAYYAREEIALAINVSRQPAASTRVIPVYLDRRPEDPADGLYGLRRLHGLVAAEVGWPRGVAERIIELFEDEPPDRPEPTAAEAPVGAGSRQGESEEHTAPAPAPPPSTWLYYLDLGLGLDRSEQWQALLKESRSSQSGLFLLYGERRQSLELFTARLWKYLTEETDQYHRIIQVPARWEGELPRTGAAWEINLRHALESGDGTAADRLSEAARHCPVFLILGAYPLSRDELDGDEEAIAALEAFLEERLPALLAGCTAAYPIRVLLAIDHERPEDSLEPRLHAKIQRGATRWGIRYRRLPEVEHITWGHIKGYLDGLDRPPPPSVYQRLERVYRSLNHGQISFKDLAERLSRKL